MGKENYFHNTENGRVLPYAVYNPQELLDFKGNPLIESLPPILSFEEAYKSLSYVPEFNDKERNLSIHYRYHALLRLTKFFQPTTQVIELENKFSRFIRHGYVGRNPYEKNHVVMLNQLHNNLISDMEINNNKVDIRNTASSFTLMGFSGIGKTSAIERVLSLYPQVLVHKSPLNIIQIVWIKINTPYDGSLKTLCMDFFQQIDNIIGTDYFEKYGTRRNSVSSMVVRIAQLARIHCIGAIVIDEIQHTLTNKRNQTEELMNFLVTLINQVGVPILLIGTMKAKQIFQKDFRQARRSSGQGDMVWQQMENDVNWDILLEGLWQFQWTKEFVPLTKEWKELLYRHSQGITDIAIKLFLLGQSYAIETGIEKITPSLIAEVKKKYLKLVAPMLEALESGIESEISKYEDITPMDIDQILINNLPQVNLKVKIEEINEKKEKKQQANELSILHKSIIALIGLDLNEQDAEKHVKQYLKRHPEATVKDTVKGVLNYFEEGLKEDLPKTKVTTLKKQNKLSLIVNNGMKKEQSALESLREKGIIQSIQDELLI